MAAAARFRAVAAPPSRILARCAGRPARGRAIAARNLALCFRNRCTRAGGTSARAFRRTALVCSSSPGRVGIVAPLRPAGGWGAGPAAARAEGAASSCCRSLHHPRGVWPSDVRPRAAARCTALHRRLDWAVRRAFALRRRHVPQAEPGARCAHLKRGGLLVVRALPGPRSRGDSAYSVLRHWHRSTHPQLARMSVRRCGSSSTGRVTAATPAPAAVAAGFPGPAPGYRRR